MSRSSDRVSGRRRISIWARNSSCWLYGRFKWVRCVTGGFYQGRDFFYAAKVRQDSCGPVDARSHSASRGLAHANARHESVGDRRRRVGKGPNGGEDEGMLVVKRELVIRVEFQEWAGASHVRHTKYAVRDDKDPGKVVREHSFAGYRPLFLSRPLQIVAFAYWQLRPWSPSLDRR